MKKHIKNFALLTIIVTILIFIANKIIDFISNVKDNLPLEGGKFYKWKYGNIYYTKSGKGNPILLIHNLDAASSSYEWNKVTKKLSKTNCVYTIDLLGCGRSDKPNLTYTNYLYVQLINDFIHEIVGEKTDVIATGSSLSFIVMACQIEPKYYNKIIGVNPTDLYELAKAPDHRKNILKFILELPIIGTFMYNMIESKNQIIDIMTDKYFYKGYLVPTQLIDAYYQAAHNKNGNGKYLFASMKSHYTNINIVPALKKINNSICLIAGKEHPYVDEIIENYKEFNPAIEDAYISNTTCLPQLESPDKFVELVRILIQS